MRPILRNHNPSETGSEVPSLPSELVLRIIELSLPSGGEQEALKVARRSLLVYCRVNRTWRGLAEPILFRRVALRRDAVNDFIRTISSRRGKSSHLAASCRQLQLSGLGTSFAADVRLDDLCATLSRLEDLTLEGIDSVNLWELLKMKNLRSLHLINDSIVRSSSTRLPRVLPKLTHLSLHATILFPNALRRSHFPHLSHLYISGYGRGGVGPQNRVQLDPTEDVLSEISPQLSVIHSDELSFAFLFGPSATLERLHTLGMRMSTLLGSFFFDHLQVKSPPRLHNLYLEDPDFFQEDEDPEATAWDWHSTMLNMFFRDTMNVTSDLPSLKLVRLAGRPIVYGQPTIDSQSDLVNLTASTGVKFLAGGTVQPAGEDRVAFERFLEEHKQEA